MANPFRHLTEGERNRSLPGKYKNAWIEESLDIEEHARLGVAHTRTYVGASLNSQKLRFFLLTVSIGLGILFLRIFYLQVLHGTQYRELAENNRLRLEPIAAERGIIYDRFNQELTQNVPNFSLALIPADLPYLPPSCIPITQSERCSALYNERQRIITRIATLSNVSPVDIEALLTKYQNYGYDSIVVKENLDYQTALALYIESANLPGLVIETGSKRRYLATPASSSATGTLSIAHLLGYLGRLNDVELKELHPKGYLPSDSIGKTGLEKSYENLLRGTYGRKKIEVNAHGKEQNIVAVEVPQPGKNLVLTIDLAAQEELERLVKKTADTTGKKRIAAVALDPRTGEIIALVSWPSFDNNAFANGIDTASYKKYIDDPDQPLFNRAISGMYPPGSTVKLIISAAALQENIVSRFTTFNSVGGFKVGGTLFKDWKVGGHGLTNVTKALAWSVNTFFYYVGGGYENFVGLGIDRIEKYLSAFNLGRKTGIDLPGEKDGAIPNKEIKKQLTGENWFVGDTYNVSIGQGGLLVTPLQVAVWTAAVANGGTIVEPHLGYKIVDPLRKTTSLISATSTKAKMVSSENLAIVRQGMRECVTYGSCKSLGALPFLTAGKTGTAQWNNNHPTHAWFTSFAPYDNPQIVVTALVEEGGEGSVAALPIAKDFLAWWGKKYLK